MVTKAAGDRKAGMAIAPDEYDVWFRRSLGNICRAVARKGVDWPQPIFMRSPLLAATNVLLTRSGRRTEDETRAAHSVDHPRFVRLIHFAS
jgi:hypothetical protein